MSSRLSRHALCPLVVAVLIVAMCGVTGRSVKSQTQAAARQQCPVFYYYDTATDHCESCKSLHCDHADHWNTQQQCRTFCSDYMRSLQCGQDQYYDVQAGHCSPCQKMPCLFHRVMGTALQCHTSCPGFQPQGGAAGTTIYPDLTPTPGRGGQDPQVQDKPAAEPATLLWILPTSLLLLTTGVLVLVWLALRSIRGRPQEQRKDPATASLVGTEMAEPIPEEMEQLRCPEVETQPGISSQLVPNGT